MQNHLAQHCTNRGCVLLLCVMTSLLASCNSGTAGSTATDYSLAPVLFVHGSGLNSGSWKGMMTALQRSGYPHEYLAAIDLVPNDGANARAAETFIAPAVERLLVAAGVAAAGAGYAGSVPERAGLIAHSMGAVSSRWYATRLKPERVSTLITIAGANHGTDALCGYDGVGNREMCPAYAKSPDESEIQYELNGAPGGVVDETPFGPGADPASRRRIPPDNDRAIVYWTIRIEPDEWIKPGHSAVLEGAGRSGEARLQVPAGLATETSTGNFLVGSEGKDHDSLPQDADVVALVQQLLRASSPSD